VAQYRGDLVLVRGLGPGGAGRGIAGQLAQGGRRQRAGHQEQHDQGDPDPGLGPVGTTAERVGIQARPPGQGHHRAPERPPHSTIIASVATAPDRALPFPGLSQVRSAAAVTDIQNGQALP
jgi:hypothetical protein